jgi:hypothetical protein
MAEETKPETTVASPCSSPDSDPAIADKSECDADDEESEDEDEAIDDEPAVDSKVIDSAFDLMVALKTTIVVKSMELLTEKKKLKQLATELLKKKNPQSDKAASSLTLACQQIENIVRMLTEDVSVRVTEAMDSLTAARQ